MLHVFSHRCRRCLFFHTAHPFFALYDILLRLPSRERRRGPAMVTHGSEAWAYGNTATLTTWSGTDRSDACVGMLASAVTARDPPSPDNDETTDKALPLISASATPKAFHPLDISMTSLMEMTLHPTIAFMVLSCAGHVSSHHPARGVLFREEKKTHRHLQIQHEMCNANTYCTLNAKERRTPLHMETFHLSQAASQ